MAEDSNSNQISNKNFIQMYYSTQLYSESEDRRENELSEIVNKFNDIKTIEDAKTLAKEIFPVNDKKHVFFIGKSKCLILNTSNIFRICLENKDEFICYNIINKKERI